MNGETGHIESAELGKRRRRSVLATSVFVALVGLFCVGSVTISVVNSFQNKATIDAVRNTQTANSPVILRLGEILEEVQRGTDRIIDCTDPEGTCYAEGQKRTSEVVGSLNEVTVVASACAAGFADLAMPARVTATRACVDEILAQSQPPEKH